jgi:hypothetical protein
MGRIPDLVQRIVKGERQLLRERIGRPTHAVGRSYEPKLGVVQREARVMNLPPAVGPVPLPDYHHPGRIEGSLIKWSRNGFSRALHFLI